MAKPILVVTIHRKGREGGKEKRKPLRFLRSLRLNPRVTEHTSYFWFVITALAAWFLTSLLSFQNLYKI